MGRDRDNVEHYCPGSTVCLSILKSIADHVEIQDATLLRNKGVLPDWMDGTPILADSETNMLLKGTDAVRYLQSLPVKKETTSQKQKKKSPLPPPFTSAKKSSSAPPPKEDEEEEEKDPSSLQDGFSLITEGDEEDGEEESKSGKVTDDELKKFMKQRESILQPSSPE